MKLPFALALAARESRSSWRRIGLYMSSITLGVAALVAINSFRASMVESVDTESRALLGADMSPPALVQLGKHKDDDLRTVLDHAHAIQELCRAVVARL